MDTPPATIRPLAVLPQGLFILATEQSPGLREPAHCFNCLTLGREPAAGVGGPGPPVTLTSGCSPGSDGLGL